MQTAANDSKVKMQLFCKNVCFVLIFYLSNPNQIPSHFHESQCNCEIEIIVAKHMNNLIVAPQDTNAISAANNLVMNAVIVEIIIRHMCVAHGKPFWC